MAYSEYPVPAFPTLSYDSIESVTFVSTVLMHIATVAFVESHESYEIGDNFTDPLSGKDDLEVPDEMNWIDFTALETFLGE